jgi:hypothetical protein
MAWDYNFANWIRKKAKEYTDSVALGQGAVQIPGPSGKQIELDEVGGYIQWRYVGDAAWIPIFAIADLKPSTEAMSNAEIQNIINNL